MLLKYSKQLQHGQAVDFQKRIYLYNLLLMDISLKMGFFFFKKHSGYAYGKKISEATLCH